MRIILKPNVTVWEWSMPSPENCIASTLTQCWEQSFQIGTAPTQMLYLAMPLHQLQIGNFALSDDLYKSF